MKDCGTIKKTDSGWVVEYIKHTPHAGLSKKGTGPAAANGRRGRLLFFDTVQLPIHPSSINLCVEGEEVKFSEELDLTEKKVFAKIIPYTPRPHSDQLIGWLVGEIIWLRKLDTHTERNLIENIVTPEEKAEYERLDKIWYNGTNYGNQRVSEEENKIQWNAYRNYAKSLRIKYLPHEIEYRDWAGYDITNMKEFFTGINSFLWNTDHCSYTFTKDDIEIKRDVCLDANLLIIKFTLDDLVEKENEK